MLNVLYGEKSSYWMFYLRKWYLVSNKRHVVYLDLILTGELILWIGAVTSAIILLVSPVKYYCAQYIGSAQKLILNVVLGNEVVFGNKLDTGNMNFTRLL